MIKRVDRRAN